MDNLGDGISKPSLRIILEFTAFFTGLKHKIKHGVPFERPHELYFQFP